MDKQLFNCEPRVGQYIITDGGNATFLTASDWDKAAFRWPLRDNGPIKSLAVNVIVTGRTCRYKNGAVQVRVKVIFVGDCEADQVANGWMDVQR